MKNWTILKAKLEKPKIISIVSHPSPDGDSIGSSLALAHYLNEKGHRVNVITPDPAPQVLSFLKGFDDILNFEKLTTQVDLAIERSEIIFALDFNNLNRLKGMEDIIIKNKEAFLVNIDHHQDPEDFADFQFCFPGASSTAELIFNFINELGDRSLLNKEIAESIYTGILTDTGSFRFSSTTSSTHHTVAALIEVGVDPSYIYQKIYDSFSIDRLKLLGFSLNERMNIYPDFHTGIIYLSDQDLKRFNFKKGDTEGLVNYPLSVGEVNFSILITEKDGKVKMSFRSKGSFSANGFAGSHFNGGGHVNAAGGISDLSVDKTVEKIEMLLEKYEDELSY